jgi:ribonuclease E
MVEDNGTPPNASEHEAPRRRAGLFSARRSGRRAQVVPRLGDDAVNEQVEPNEPVEPTDAAATASDATGDAEATTLSTEAEPSAG